MSLKSITSVSTSTINVKMNYYSSISGRAISRYHIEVYNSSGTLLHEYRPTWDQIGNPNGTFFTNGYNFTSLTNHRTTSNYRVKTYIATSAGNEKINDVWTRAGSLSSAPYAYSITRTSAYLTWGSAPDITGYGVEVYESYVGNGDPVYSSYGASMTRYVSGLNPGTKYGYKVYPMGILANGPYHTGNFTTDAPQLPTTVTGLSLSASSSSPTISVSWNNVSYETGYQIELYRGNSTSSSNYITRKATDANITSTTFYSSDGVEPYSTYTVKVYGWNSDGNGGYDTAVITTKDTVDPTVSINSTSGLGRVYFSYSGYDAHSGLRSTSTYLISIGSKNGSQATMVDKEYTTLTNKSFDSDANNLPFEHGAYYWIGVRAYDASGNYSTKAVAQVQYQMTRPGNWAWHTSKTAGEPINVTATEWNSLTTRINQFRTYKNMSFVNFTTVSRGSTITASVVNEARNAVAAMNPPTSAPSSVSKGSTITAYFFNRLVDSMNSIR